MDIQFPQIIHFYLTFDTFLNMDCVLQPCKTTGKVSVLCISILIFFKVTDPVTVSILNIGNISHIYPLLKFTQNLALKHFNVF